MYSREIARLHMVLGSCSSPCSAARLRKGPCSQLPHAPNRHALRARATLALTCRSADARWCLRSTSSTTRSWPRCLGTAQCAQWRSWSRPQPRARCGRCQGLLCNDAPDISPRLWAVSHYFSMQPKEGCKRWSAGAGSSMFRNCA